MKKTIIGAVIIVVLGLIGYNFYLGQQKTPVKEPQSAETTSATKISSEEEKSLTSETTSTESSEKEKETTSTTSQEEQAKQVEIKPILETFGKNWVNYDTIYKRNQSVKDLFTEKGQQENGLDSDPKVDTKATGEIKTISANLDQPNQYVLIGEERVRDMVNSIVLEVTLVQEGSVYKIDKLVVNYMRQAY